MITITNNYFADLNTAIEAGLYLKGAKPKKAALYEAIAAHNEVAAAPDEVPTVLEAEPALGHTIPPAPVGVEPLIQDINALEAAGDEAAVQAALLAMDAEDAVQAAQIAQTTPIQSPQKTRRTPMENFEKLRDADLAVQGSDLKTVAGQMGTSPGRLVKLVKAFQLLSNYPEIQAAFLAGKIGYDYLCESAVRRDGMERLRALAS